MWPKNMGLAQGNDWATAIAGGSEAVVGQARLTVLAMSGQHPGLASIAGRSFFLSGQLLLGNLSKTVVVVGNTPHDRPSFLVCHLIGNRASFLCTEAPMLRVPDELAGWHGHYQEFIGAKKHLVLGLLSHTFPSQGSYVLARG